MPHRIVSICCSSGPAGGTFGRYIALDEIRRRELADVESNTQNSYPPDTEEKQKALGAFFGEFPPPKIAGLVPAYVDAVKAHSPSVSKLAMLDRKSVV